MWYSLIETTSHASQALAFFLAKKLDITARQRSPSTVTLRFAALLKKYGLMMPPNNKPHQTVTFWMRWQLLQCFWLLYTPKSTILLIYEPIKPNMNFVAEHNERAMNKCCKKIPFENLLYIERRFLWLKSIPSIFTHD